MKITVIACFYVAIKITIIAYLFPYPSTIFLAHFQVDQGHWSE